MSRGRFHLARALQRSVFVFLFLFFFYFASDRRSETTRHPPTRSHARIRENVRERSSCGRLTPFRMFCVAADRNGPPPVASATSCISALSFFFLPSWLSILFWSGTSWNWTDSMAWMCLCPTIWRACLTSSPSLMRTATRCTGGRESGLPHELIKHTNVEEGDARAFRYERTTTASDVWIVRCLRLSLSLRLASSPMDNHFLSHVFTSRFFSPCAGQQHNSRVASRRSNCACSPAACNRKK